jgi:GTP-binding protein Era
LFNKVDCLRKEESQARADLFQNKLTELLKERGILLEQTLKISGLSGTGLKELLEKSWTFIPEGPHHYPDPDQVSDRPVRFFVAEKIREQLFHCLGDEVPYSCAVEIQQFNESAVPVRIEATIHVERESQKGIVIGQGGKKIKEIGQAARKEIEEFMEQKIFLGLKVDLLKNWTQNPKDLERMGYNS